MIWEREGCKSGQRSEVSLSFSQSSKNEEQRQTSIFETYDEGMNGYRRVFDGV